GQIPRFGEPMPPARPSLRTGAGKMRPINPLHLAVALVVLAGNVALIPAPVATAQEQPITPEVNPPGDIPDSQVFVTYASPAGFSIKVPEGWARTERSDGAHFADKYGRVDISVAPAASAPTAERVRKGEAAAWG